MSDEQLLVRSFDARLDEVGDGRTLVGRCVPFNEVATVSDGGTAYQEMFVQGAFARAVKAPNRVWLNFEHSAGISNVLGHGVAFEEHRDGLYGTLRIDEGADGEKALRLHREGILESLSVQFRPMSRQRIQDGIVVRDSVHLDAVALCREGAYEGAKVLAVRAKDVLAEQRPADLDPALAQSLSRFIDMPEGMVLLRAFTEQPWDGSPSRFDSTAAYCAACAIDDNPAGAPKVQALCHLPFKEPNGDINVNALRNALARLDQVQTTQANKASARRMLERMLAEFNNRP